MIRHGQTQSEDSLGGENGIIGGWLDLHLTPLGRKESQDLGSKLTQFPITRMVSSDLSRSVETARLIEKRLNPKPKLNVSHSLRTWNLGDLTGKPVKEVRDTIQTLVDKKFTPPPGGGETFQEFSSRVIKFLSMVLQNAEKLEGQAIALVTHGRCIQISKVWLERGEDGLNSTTASGKHAGVETGQALILNRNSRTWDTKLVE